MSAPSSDLELTSATLAPSKAIRPEPTSIATPAKFVSLKTFLQIWPVLLVVVITGLTLAAQH